MSRSFVFSAHKKLTINMQLYKLQRRRRRGHDASAAAVSGVRRQRRTATGRRRGARLCTVDDDGESADYIVLVRCLCLASSGADCYIRLPIKLHAASSSEGSNVTLLYLFAAFASSRPAPIATFVCIILHGLREHLKQKHTLHYFRHALT